MQIGECKVRLNGDLLNVVPRSDITPPEVILLRAIHGEDSVIDIKQTGSDKRQHREEYDRLFEKYGEAPDGKEKSILKTIWPNPHGIRFPANFAEIGVDIYEEEADEQSDEPKGPTPLSFDRPASASKSKQPAKA